MISVLVNYTFKSFHFIAPMTPFSLIFPHHTTLLFASLTNALLTLAQTFGALTLHRVAVYHICSIWFFFFSNLMGLNGMFTVWDIFLITKPTSWSFSTALLSNKLYSLPGTDVCILLRLHDTSLYTGMTSDCNRITLEISQQWWWILLQITVHMRNFLACWNYICLFEYKPKIKNLKQPLMYHELLNQPKGTPI